MVLAITLLENGFTHIEKKNKNMCNCNCCKSSPIDHAVVQPSESILSAIRGFENSKQLAWDIYHLDLAKKASTKSKDPSTQTGAVIVRPDNSVVSTGFNGFPKKMLDAEHLYANREEKYRRIIHCEMNALLYARERVDGCTLITYPFMSCDRCFVHMVQAGIVRFVAPKPSEDKLARWGEAFQWVRNEAKLMGVEIVEIDYE